MQLSAFYSNSVDVILTEPMDVEVQLYISTTPNNDFVPVPGAIVQMTVPAGAVPVGGVGGVFNGTTPLFAIPVVNEDRLLLVVRVLPNDTEAAATLTGYISAGLSIA